MSIEVIVRTPHLAGIPAKTAKTRALVAVGISKQGARREGHRRQGGPARGSEERERIGGYERREHKGRSGRSWRPPKAKNAIADLEI